MRIQAQQNERLPLSLAIESLFDLFNELPSVVVCPLATLQRDDADQFRLDVAPSPRNGLHEPSQIAVDKITVVPMAKIGAVIGDADDAPSCASTGRWLSS